jgi:hypothetical protein
MNNTVNMNLSFIESLLDKVAKPDRVEIKLLDRKYLLIQSAENTNDTIGWFHINSRVLEDEFEANNLSWCYVFETAPKQAPCIYMFVGEKLTKENLKAFLEDGEETLPEGRKIYYEDISFSEIDIDQYDNSMTVLEQELFRKAGEVFKVYEP